MRLYRGQSSSLISSIVARGFLVISFSVIVQFVSGLLVP